ncbi:MAG: glucokinase [Granulosicoccaceae bacterium]
MGITDRLVADIGGTNARFAMLDELGNLQSTVTLPCDDYANLPTALEHYLNKQNITKLDQVAMAVATPVSGDRVTLTNRPNWSFSQQQLKDSLKLSSLTLLNDYSALALSLPHLSKDDVRIVGPALKPALGAIALIGPGTGLGVSGLVPTFNASGEVIQYGTLVGEGGHVTLGVATDREQAMYKVLENKYGHVSAERVLSGPGMAELYLVLKQLDGIEAEPLMPAQISKGALQDNDAACLETLNMFCALLGSCAGNLALTVGAAGGVYIGGGITPKLGQFFIDSAFRERFEAKGRMRTMLEKMPTFVIIAPYPALIGCAKAM